MTYDYDSFGNEINPDAKDDNSFRYCGEYYDRETEEIYLRARYYQPAVGRFLTRDTYMGEDNEPLSLHLYTYCENDGVNMCDSNGHWKSVIHGDMTNVAAMALGFSVDDAEIIAEGCKLADKRVKGSKWKVTRK